MQCAEFDALLAEAIDGTLSGQRRENFEQHKAGCAACQALFAEVTSGVAWLEEMEDVAPPRKLVHNILAATSGAAQLEAQSRAAALRVGAAAAPGGDLFAPVLTARFANVHGDGVLLDHAGAEHGADPDQGPDPAQPEPHVFSSQNKLMKYYENMRLVYEIESRVRTLRNATDESEREERNRRHEKNNNQTQEQNQNSEPERRQQQELQPRSQPALAGGAGRK